MVRQMQKARIPTDFVEFGRPASIPSATRGHERVQYENRWRAPVVSSQEKFRARRVVRRKFRIDWAGPCDYCPTILSQVRHARSEPVRVMTITRNSVVIIWRQLLAFTDISVHLIATAPL